MSSFIIGCARPIQSNNAGGEMYESFEKLTGFLWGIPLLGIVLLAGLYFTMRSGGFQFSHLGLILKSVFSGGKKDDDGSNLTPFQAVSIAVGGTVGVSNMGGVATAIATGGPGAVFWLWIAALLGMMLKMVEVTLAVYYRKTKSDGTFKGGPTYYIQYALGEEKKFKAWKLLAAIFGGGLMVIYFITIQNYTISEAVGSTFNLNYLIPSALVALCTWAIILGGLKKIGEIASYLVPIMSIFYIVCVLFIIVKNISSLPSVFKLIFEDAFTSKAALGGIAGASVAKAMRLGFARSVFSNEAGWGTSPMIHATSQTDHPIKQGLLGAFEVFADTIVICSFSAILILITGYWSSGLSGAELTLTAFESGMGYFARVVLAISIFFFGLTTITGWFTYFDIIVDHAIPDDSTFKRNLVRIFRICYPLPGFILVAITLKYGGTPKEIWTFGDFTSVIPTFVNVAVLLVIGGKFFELLQDYKARYLGVGTVDPNMKLFYEDNKKEN